MNVKRSEVEAKDKGCELLQSINAERVEACKAKFNVFKDGKLDLKSQSLRTVDKQL